MQQIIPHRGLNSQKDEVELTTSFTVPNTSPSSHENEMDTRLRLLHLCLPPLPPPSATPLPLSPIIWMQQLIRQRGLNSQRVELTPRFTVQHKRPSSREMDMRVRLLHLCLHLSLCHCHCHCQCHCHYHCHHSLCHCQCHCHRHQEYGCNNSFVKED